MVSWTLERVCDGFPLTLTFILMLRITRHGKNTLDVPLSFHGLDSANPK